MKRNQTITVWKSDFKDFPGLYEATMWCIGAAVQKASNFVVIRGSNPYEMLDMFIEKDFYSQCLSLASENGWAPQVSSLLHDMKYNSIKVLHVILGKLNYPEGHIKRSWY